MNRSVITTTTTLILGLFMSSCCSPFPSREPVSVPVSCVVKADQDLTFEVSLDNKFVSSGRTTNRQQQIATFGATTGPHKLTVTAGDERPLTKTIFVTEGVAQGQQYFFSFRASDASYRSGLSLVEPIKLYGGTAAGLAMDKKDTLYIAENRDTPRISTVTSYGERHMLLPAGTLGAVTALAVDDGGNVYAADGGGNGNAKTHPNNKVWKITPEGEATVLIPSIANPTGLALDKHNNLYVSSYDDKAVYLYNRKGKLIRKVIEFDINPYGLTLDKRGNLYVACFGTGGAPYGKTVWRVDRKGQGEIYCTLGAPDPHSLAFDQAGNLWVTLYNGLKLGKITPEKVATLFPGGWTADDAGNGLVFDSHGNLYVAVNGGYTTREPAVIKIPSDKLR